MGWISFLPVACLCLLMGAAHAHATDDFVYVHDVAVTLQEEGSLVVDTRPGDVCKHRTLAGAICLPAKDFLGPHQRLPSERDLLWLLGTAGLKGGETVLVVGQDATARDFVAGLLYVSGQRHVSVLTEPVGRLLERGGPTGPGRERSFVREQVFEAPMRDELVILRDELSAMNPSPLLLDGRPEAEYWGEVARSPRSGHLPSAISMPALALRASLATRGTGLVFPKSEPVVYGHDAYEGLAYLTLLIAGHGVPARLYLAGWSEWAADGTLPIDAAAYPDQALARTANTQAASQRVGMATGTVVVAIVGMGLIAFSAGWWLKQKRAI